MSEYILSNPTAPGEPNWELLQTAFGPALVPLGSDERCQASLAFDKLPFGNTMIAEGEELSPTKPAGVVCGEKTGLMALGFALEEPAKQFLAGNPVLSGTIVTGFQKNLLVWLQPTNRLPPNTMLEGIQVITDGIVPVHAKPEISVCTVFQVGKPLVLNLDTLTFPEALRPFFVDWAVRDKFGPPLIQASRRRKVLNQAYWAVGISKLTGLRYEQSEKVFSVWDPQSQRDVALELAGVYNLVASMLQKSNVPPSEFSPARIKAVVEAIKMFCTTSTRTLAGHVMEFVQTRLEPRDGTALAKNAAAAACKQFLENRFKVSENKVKYEMSQAILKHFGIGESHDQGRVFHGLALRFDGPGPNEKMKPKDAGAAPT